MFERSVRIDGTIYREHEATRITHDIGKRTTVRIRSSAGRERRDDQHQLPLDVGMTFQEAEEAVMALPFYAECEDPLAGELSELEELAEQQAALIDEVAVMLDDESAATVPQAFREWEPGAAYAIGDRRRYDGILYKCISPHTSDEAYPPSTAVSLWAAIIASDDPDNPLPWVQPDSTNPYMKGDRVTHGGKIWESDIDYNVFEPGVAGWTEV